MDIHSTVVTIRAVVRHPLGFDGEAVADLESDVAALSRGDYEIEHIEVQKCEPEDWHLA